SSVQWEEREDRPEWQVRVTTVEGKTLVKLEDGEMFEPEDAKSGRQETEVRSQESGDRSQKSGDRSQKSGDRSRESGDRSQEAGDRSQESGDRSQKTAAWQMAKLKLQISDRPDEG
ncbi:MAG TPA: hypothetical protein VL523_14460, partial [Terriglobia bacterium]|nr:hypothetical protein [Terriglobia bacterium]